MSSILHQIHGQTRDIGFPVRRLLPAAAVRTVGPFVFFDHMGPARFIAASTEGDVRPHPHIGLATVTYLYSGAFVHRDSLGSVQRIVPGDINWMAAGRGIVHSERVPDDIRAAGIAVQGLQMWVALPMTGELGEDGAPRFHHYPAWALPCAESAGCRLQVLIGSAFGKASPVPTPTKTLYAALEFQPGGRLTVAPEHRERGIYVVQGAVTIDGERVAAGTLAVLTAGIEVELVAADGMASAMLLGGDPLDGPRFVWWNFVASSKARLEAAKAAWLSQQRDIFPAVPGETEFIPLPQR